MKCNCGFKSEEKEFGKIEIQGGGMYGARAVGKMQDLHIGSVYFLVCPKCGAIYTTMRGQINNK